MGAQTLLHSGSFVDYNGNEIIVEFYKRVDLNSEPSYIEVDGDSHTSTMVVWSRSGEAHIDDYPLWMTAGEIWTTEVPGTSYHKHWYAVSIEQNVGLARDGVIKVGILNMSWAQIEVPVHQQGLTMSVVPNNILYNATQSTNGITVYWYDGYEPTISIRYTLGEGGWLTNNGSYIQDEHTKEWSFTASENTTEISREAYIDVTNGIDTLSVFVKQRTQ